MSPNELRRGLKLESHARAQYAATGLTAFYHFLDHAPKLGGLERIVFGFPVKCRDLPDWTGLSTVPAPKTMEDIIAATFHRVDLFNELFAINVQLVRKAGVILGKHIGLGADLFVGQELQALVAVEAIGVSKDFIEDEVDLSPYHRLRADQEQFFGTKRNGEGGIKDEELLRHG